MAQHDYVIANSDGLTVRGDINNVLAAIQTLNSGGTAPTVTVAYMLWVDTTENQLKQRNAADSSWIGKGLLSEKIGRSILSINTTQVGTDADTSEKTLMSFSLPANTIRNDGEGIRVSAWGVAVVPITSVTLRIKFGGLVIHIDGPTLTGITNWWWDFIIYRTGSAGQDILPAMGVWNNVVTLQGFQVDTEDWTTATLIEITGQNGASPAANDLVCLGLKVEYLP